jgi:hypothetical protein
MLPNTSAGMVVVKKEDKELKLRQLLIEGLAAVAPVQGTQSKAVVRVVAQSMASPVVKVLVALQTELAAAGVDTLMILAKAEAAPRLKIGQTTAYRHLADVRCHDAHESLVLGTATAWIGDCMRRDPATRDSFELHARDTIETARGVSLSFDRMWRLAQAFQVAEDCASLEMAGNLAALGQEAPAPQVLTRH